MLRNAVQKALLKHASWSGIVDVLITSSERIKDLNRAFRGIDEPTDVLTFPASPMPNPPAAMPRIMGDIAISIDFATEQAQLRGVPVDDEVAYLGMHGALHLCGFDDIDDVDRLAMQRAMYELGAELGLAPQLEWQTLELCKGAHGRRIE